MPRGGWNKGKAHSSETRAKISENYSKPKPRKIDTDQKCQYGCGEIAQFIFANGKICCSEHFNSCSRKRKKYSETFQKEWADKSLQKRIETGVTKTSRRKAVDTMRRNGTLETMRKKMQEHWKTNPWENNPRCPILPYKETPLPYQGKWEYAFLEKIEERYGLDWIAENVQRGPRIWYIDPIDKIKRLYISDFLIGNTVYEIKSRWTWNHHGKDKELEEKNKAKLTSTKELGYNVILVLDHKEKQW